MSCKHSAGDPACSSHPDHDRYYPPETEVQVSKSSVDSTDFEFIRVEEVGNHFVAEVKYPNCISCAYEGRKVMVFLNTKAIDALKWREVDPHFRDPKSGRTARQAPPPACRFPASQQGWAWAMEWATAHQEKD